MLDQNLGQTKSQEDQKQEDLYFYTQSWIWRAVEALVLAKDFDPSPRAIANRLNVSVEAVVDALDGLERINAITREGRTFKRTQSYHSVNVSNSTRQQLLDSHTNISSQIVSKLNPESIFTNVICLGNKDIIIKHADKLRNFISSLVEEGKDLNNPDVIAVEISIAAIENNTKNPNGVHNA